jgi:hypothetical protein
MLPVTENVFGIDPYAVFAVVPYLQVAFSFVLTEIVVEVVPESSDPVGCGLLSPGAVESVVLANVKSTKDVLLYSDPAVPITVTIEEPAGVPEEVENVPVEVQLGVHDVENEAVVPAGRPEDERDTD